MTTPEPCAPIFQHDPRRLLCSCGAPFDPDVLGTGWAPHVIARAQAHFPVDLSGHALTAYMHPHGSPDGPGWVARVDCTCGEENPGASLDSPQEAAARALADWATHVWAVGLLGDAPTLRPTRSCATCANVDTTLRNDDLIMECHLAPPCTMPPAPALPEATVAVDDGRIPLVEFAYAEPHRYPVVTETDWCASYTPQETPDGP